MLQIGDCQIRRIVEQEGPTFLPQDFLLGFHPDLLRQHPKAATAALIDPATGALVLSFHSFIVTTRHHTVLIDTCCGNDKSRPGRAIGDALQTDYLARLHRMGFAPEEIDYVFCTHLHWDHVGWNTRLEGGRWVPTFANAKYVFARKEFDAWQACLAAGEGSLHVAALQDSVLPIIDAGQAVFVDDGFTLDDNLIIEASPGHAPGHISIQLQSGGQSVSFTGDAIHHPLQIAEPGLATIACWDPAAAIATRRRILEHHSETGALILPAHFPAPTACRISCRHERFEFAFPKIPRDGWS